MKPRYEKESKIIAANLRAIMAKKKVAPKHIAEVIGTSEEFVRSILRDERVLYHPDAIAIAKFLEVELKEFVKKI